MAAPEYVPSKAVETVRTYSSPPRRLGSWKADRPGDLGGAGQPHGSHFGNQGPDQGYALGLARRYQGTIFPSDAERPDDVTAGAVAIALKRASLFGRAPVMADLRVAYTLWGFPDVAAPPELVELRTKLFAGVGHPHHYAELRRVADSVADGTLRLTPDEVAERYGTDWQSLLSV